MINYPFVNRYLIMVNGFVCPWSPRGYVVRGFLCPGKVSHCKLVLGEGPDKEQFKKTHEQKTKGTIHPALKPGPGKVPEDDSLVAGP